MALMTAPSTLGLAQKSPQIANFVLLSQTHLSSPPTAMAGKAPPLELHKLGNINEEKNGSYSNAIKDDNCKKVWLKKLTICELS
jgi:hypothetical protein